MVQKEILKENENDKEKIFENKKAMPTKLGAHAFLH